MNDLKLHPRHFIVNKAALEISKAILDATSNYKLTYGELTRILASELGSLAKYQIREERHPNDLDAPGDLA